MSLRSALYAAARLLGDINAISRGPKAVAGRLRRRLVWRAVGRLLRRIG